MMFFLLDRLLKPYLLRRWPGVAPMVVGVVGCVVASQIRLLGVTWVAIGFCRGAGGLKRRRFEQVG